MRLADREAANLARENDMRDYCNHCRNAGTQALATERVIYTLDCYPYETTDYACLYHARIERLVHATNPHVLVHTESVTLQETWSN